MIASPLDLTSTIRELWSDDTTVIEIFIEKPRYIDECLTDVPWFFFKENDLSKLLEKNKAYMFSSSAINWNKIKLEIYNCFSRDSTLVHQKNIPSSFDWEYFVHFITKQCKKNDLWTKRGWPRQYNSDTYWLNKDIQDIFFGTYNKTIDEAFKNEPSTIERLLCFDIDLFFDDENLLKLTESNPNYKLSTRALLWNSEKYNFWLERRKEEVRQSRSDWEGLIAAEELQNARINDPNYDSDDEDYFNANTDGKLGNFDNFTGSIDNLDDWSGK